MTVHLISGDDASLVLSALTELVHRLVGDGDRSLMVDEFDHPDDEMRAIVDAAQTPPFLTDHRVVIVRDVGRFTSDDVAPLVAYLTDPLPTTHLVVVAGGGKTAKSLADALKACGAQVHDTTPPSKAKDRTAWVEQQFAAEGVRIDASALQAVAAWMGEDAGRLQGVIETLASTYGTATKLRADDVRPFLGEAGGVPPWDLTDAIDKGDTTRSLDLLHRMTGAGGRHPLQVMAILHGHYTKLLKLDGADARDEASAAAALGIKLGFPARKALDQYRKLGGSGVTRAVGLLAQADLDLRGAKEWPDSLVMEVLVARLSKLAGTGRR
ncbi:MAG: DNA polymerase III subunit delta [Actinobacteria bacterium]|uniref:DNA polymerase III subunit delta n=1 Tax=freshwater metagenome TaxID=449393 RepID=A0A6J6GE20_9ZZZZ|nr:DNA polymerase III subunit delta [Actinomycetota bacterium]